MSAGIDTIVWDLGGVLVDWNPLFVYNEQYFNSPSDRDYFFHISVLRIGMSNKMPAIRYSKLQQIN